MNYAGTACPTRASADARTDGNKAVKRVATTVLRQNTTKAVSKPPKYVLNTLTRKLGTDGYLPPYKVEEIVTVVTRHDLAMVFVADS